MTSARRELGIAGEALAAAWYQERGWQVLATNWRCRDGEIDLVVRRGPVLVFCEVKTRSSTAFSLPAEAVTPVKQTRLRRLAMLWLADTGHSARQLRFDVAAVLGGNVDVIEGAF